MEIRDIYSPNTKSMSLRKANPIREGREKAHVAPKIMIGDLGEGFFFFFSPSLKSLHPPYSWHFTIVLIMEPTVLPRVR